MKRTIITTTLINDILISLQSSGAIADENLSTAKMILEMHLCPYQITHEDETALSTDLDLTESYLQQFLLDMRMRGCTDGSIKSYGWELRTFLNFVNKNVKDIKYPDIMAYLVHGRISRKWRDATYNGKLIQIRSFFSYLYAEDLLPDNPGKKLKETKVERKIGSTISPYQREEVKSSCINERELALCEMLYSTGARISELLAMNRTDIDMISMKAVVYGKGRKEREVYFTAPAKFHLERYLASRTDDNAALFVSSRKPYGRLTPAGARNILKLIKSRDENIANIKLTPHTFRRSVGTDMINRGAPLEIVAEKLGHVQLDTTKKCYASISRETVHQAHNRYVQ